MAGGPELLLDLVGARTVVDSLRLVRRGGTVCVAGSLSGWLIRGLRADRDDPVRHPAHGLPQRRRQGQRGRGGAPAGRREVEAGAYRPNVDRVFGLDDIAAAHRYMEDNAATGKVVVSTR